MIWKTKQLREREREIRRKITEEQKSDVFGKKLNRIEKELRQNVSGKSKKIEPKIKSIERL